MRKNQELQDGQGDGGGSKKTEVSDELAQALNALRKRVSVMDQRMDRGPAMKSGKSGGGRRTTVRRQSSFDSLCAASADMLDLTGPRSSGGGGGGGKVMMD